MCDYCDLDKKDNVPSWDSCVDELFRHVRQYFERERVVVCRDCKNV